MHLSSAYNRAREYLEDNGPLSVDAFKAQFNDQLFRRKGADWIREGLLFEGFTQEKERETTRAAFFEEAAKVKADKQAGKRPSFEEQVEVARLQAQETSIQVETQQEQVVQEQVEQVAPEKQKRKRRFGRVRSIFFRERARRQGQ